MRTIRNGVITAQGILDMPQIARIFCFLVLFCTAWSLTTKAEESASGFSDLQSLTLKDVGITLHYNVGLSELLDSKPYNAGNDSEYTSLAYRPLRTQILGAGKWYFTIECDNGPSGDDHCTFLQEDNGELKSVANIDGVDFTFPGNGNIYVNGHNDTMFDVRKKYEWRNGSFSETKQPFYYVGLDTTTREKLEIFSAKDNKDVVATLPKGTRLTVILNEEEYYLIKTTFGLLGWVRISECPQEQSPIVGIYFAGD